MQSKQPPEDAFRALDSLKGRLGSGARPYKFGVGLKRSGGNILDEVSLIVYVPKKLPLSELPAELHVPTEHQQFRTDVVEARFIPIADQAFYEPLRGGIEISPSGVPISHGLRVEEGTLGCVVRRRSDGARLLLTCAHVASHNDEDDNDLQDAVGQNIFQPSDGENTATVIGSCVAADFDLDAALIAPNGTRSLRSTIEEIGSLRGPGTVNYFDPVRKRGRSTGLTSGIVLAFLSDSSGTPRTIEFGGFPPGQIVNHGDSGSAVVNARQEIVGLLTQMTDETGTNGLATMIAPIQNTFEVDIVVKPSIASIAPNSAIITALGPVVITGFGFDTPAHVYFGGTPAAVISQTSTKLEVFPPPMLVATTMDVTVTNQWGESSEPGPAAQFHYLPIV